MELFLTSVWGPEFSAEIAKAAEDSGFSAVWLAEHHGTPYGRCPDVIGLARSILDNTARLHVGTAIVPYSHWPAEQLIAAVRDLPSNRFTLGVGRGTPAEMAVPPRHSAPFPDWLRAVAAAVPGVKVAAVSAETIKLASSLGLPLLIGKENDDAMVAEKLRLWGPGGDHVRLILPSTVDTDWLKAWQGPAMAQRLINIRTILGVPRKMLMIEAAGQSGVRAALSAVRTEG